jgi:hypothetical protein
MSLNKAKGLSKTPTLQKVTEIGSTSDQNMGLTGNLSVGKNSADAGFRIHAYESSTNAKTRVETANATSFAVRSFKTPSYNIEFNLNDSTGEFQLYSQTAGASRARVSSEGTHQFGTAANHAQIAPDGEITLAGTGRVTKKDRIWAQNLGIGATKPDQSIVDNFVVQSYDINDDSVFQWEVPDDWAVGTDVTVHLHWACNEAFATNSGEVQWEVAWRAVAEDEVYSTGGASGTIDSGDINIATNAREIVHTDLGTIAAANLAVDDAVGMTLKRVALDDGANPTADPEVLVIAMVYTSDKLGKAT